MGKSTRTRAATGALAVLAMVALGMGQVKPPAGGRVQAGGSDAGGAMALLIGGRRVSPMEYRQALTALGAPAPESLSPAARRAEAESYLRFARLLAAARRAGLARSAAYQAQLRGAAEKLLVRMYAAQLRARAARIPAAAVTAYLRQHQAAYGHLTAAVARARIRGVLFHRRYRAAMAALRRAFPAKLNGAYFAAPAQQ